MQPILHASKSEGNESDMDRIGEDLQQLVFLVRRVRLKYIQRAKSSAYIIVSSVFPERNFSNCATKKMERDLSRVHHLMNVLEVNMVQTFLLRSRTRN